MKCDQCENEATVHEVTRKHGVTIEKHLCEQCAREQGIASQPPTHLESLLTHFMTHPPAAPSSEPPAPPPGVGVAGGPCRSCSLSFAEFKKAGLLGCPDCYRTFEGALASLLERAHEGMSRHVGKVPKRLLSGVGKSGSPPDAALGGAEDRSQRLHLLRKQLADAVKAEQYERAAKLRDEMLRLGDTGGIPGSPPPPPPPPPPPSPGDAGPA